MANVKRFADTEKFSLEDCFRHIVEGKQLELDLNTLNTILKKNLQVNFNLLKPKVKIILPYMLIQFIKAWPGWQKSINYMNKQISFENWYEKFKEYLIYKVNYMIKNDFDKAVAMVKTNLPMEECLFKIDNSTQTNLSGEKPAAPFSVQISGPAKVLNSLVFCESVKDDILVKEYRVNTSWNQQLTTKQLINWPYIDVEFKSQYLHFKRSNRHDFKRCLTFSTEKIFFKKSETFIEEIDILDEKVARQAYTLNAIKEFCTSYIKVLRNHQVMLDWSEGGLKEIEVILEDFVLDIVDINMNSIATNTSVLFNIGNSIYARNKSIKTSDQAICFAECITPKLLLSLVSFTGIKEADNSLPFEDLLSVSPSNLNGLLPSVTYTCTFCQASYSKFADVWIHLKNTHIMEQPVLCFKCKLQFNISNLTDNRWHHQCKKSAGAGKKNDRQS